MAFVHKSENLKDSLCPKSRLQNSWLAPFFIFYSFNNVNVNWLSNVGDFFFFAN